MSPPNATKNAKKASHAPPYLVSYQASKLRHAGAPPARRAARWLRPRAAARRPFAPPRATWRWRTPGRSCASGRGTTRSSGEIRRTAPPAHVHSSPPCQRACPARCSEPAAAADQASGQPDQRTYREASPHPAAAWRLARAHRPARTRSWQAGQAAALVELAPGAAGRRARAVPGDHRVPERAAPPTDGSRRGGTPLLLTRVTARTGTRGRHSLLRAKRTACPGGPLCRRLGP